MRRRRQGCVDSDDELEALADRHRAADRRPIDPPPIVQLRVIDPSRKNRAVEPSTSGGGDAEDDAYAQSFLQNPYYFMFASLAKPDEDVEIHWLKVRPGVCPPRTCSGHLVGRFSLLLVTRESRRGGCLMICRHPASGGREERYRMGPHERTCPYLRTSCIISSASLRRVSS